MKLYLKAAQSLCVLKLTELLLASSVILLQEKNIIHFCQNHVPEI